MILWLLHDSCGLRVHNIFVSVAYVAIIHRIIRVNLLLPFEFQFLLTGSDAVLRVLIRSWIHHVLSIGLIDGGSFFVLRSKRIIVGIHIPLSLINS